MTDTNTTTNTDQNKAPVQAPGSETKTPEQLALDKKNEQSKSVPTTDQKNNPSTEKKA